MDIVETWKEYWTTVAKGAGWLTGVIGAFLIEPPLLTPHTDVPGLWLHLSQFLLAIILGLFFINTKARPKEGKRWRLIAIAAVVAGVILFIAYQVLRPSWSCPYIDVSVMTGPMSSLSVDAAQFMTNPANTCDRLIAAALGHTEQIWPMRTLIQRYIIICLVYTLSMLCLSAAAMSTVEYMRATRALSEPRQGAK